MLGLIYKPTNADYQPVAIPEISDSVELAQLFAHGLPDYMKEIALALLPIVLFFGLFQIFALRLSGKDTGEDPDRAGVYLYRSGIVSDRRKCGLYASR